jgi:hypothetical protein
MISEKRHNALGMYIVNEWNSHMNHTDRSIIQILAYTPIHNAYKLPSKCSIQEASLFHGYMSHLHVELLTLLHKLGLRGPA